MDQDNFQLAVNQNGCYIQRTMIKSNEVSQYSIRRTLEELTLLVMNIINEFGHQPEYMNYFYQKLLDLNDSLNLDLAMHISESTITPLQPSAAKARIDSITQGLLLLLQRLLNTELEENRDNLGAWIEESCKVVKTVIGCVTLTLEFTCYESFKKALTDLLSGEWRRQIFDLIIRRAKEAFEEFIQQKNPSFYGIASDIFKNCLSLFDVKLSLDERNIGDYFSASKQVNLTISIEMRQNLSTMEKYETSSFSKKVKELKDLYDLLERFYPDTEVGTRMKTDSDERSELQVAELKEQRSELTSVLGVKKKELKESYTEVEFTTKKPREQFTANMERLLCEEGQCDESAISFCFKCKSFLCRLHRIEDVKRQQANGDPEHYYTDALQYRCNEDKFISLYCKEHPNQLLIRRCINCFQVACNDCLPQRCTKAGGRYHDNNMIKDFVGSYKHKLAELRMRLQKRHSKFLLNLKEACCKQHKTESELKELLHDIDRAVESQKAAVTEEGEELKQEILKELSQVSSQITEQIQSIEEKEATSRQLLDDMHGIMHTAGSFMAVHSYPRLHEKVTDMMKWRIPKTELKTYSLSQGTKQKSLGLELIQREATPIEVSEEEDPEQPEESTTEVKLLKCQTSDKQRYRGLSFLSEDKVITWGQDYGGYGQSYFTETREGETLSRQTSDSLVCQLLPYCSQLLMLTWKAGNYRVTFQDTDKALYEFIHSSPYYSHGLMAVTCDNQLMVLQEDTQTLHVVHLDTKAEKDLSLRSVGKRVFSVTASSDGKIILVCAEVKEKKQSKLKQLFSKKEEERHSVIKYDPELQQVVWVSDSLLTVTDMDQLLGDRLLRARLHVACYLDFLYVLSSYRPSIVLRVSLSDGRVVQKIPCDGLPEEVVDISMRGNTLATAGYHRINYYKISDITDVV